MLNNPSANLARPSSLKPFLVGGDKMAFRFPSRLPARVVLDQGLKTCQRAIKSLLRALMALVQPRSGRVEMRISKIPATAFGSALAASGEHQGTKPGLKDLKKPIAHVLGGSLVAGKPLFSNP